MHVPWPSPQNPSASIFPCEKACGRIPPTVLSPVCAGARQRRSAAAQLFVHASSNMDLERLERDHSLLWQEGKEVRRASAPWCIQTSPPADPCPDIRIPSPRYLLTDPHELISGKSISGTWGGSSNLDKDINRFNRFFRDNRISYKVFFSKTYKLDKINNAFKDLEKGNILRPLIKMEH